MVVVNTTSGCSHSTSVHGSDLDPMIVRSAMDRPLVVCTPRANTRWVNKETCCLWVSQLHDRVLWKNVFGNQIVEGGAGEAPLCYSGWCEGRGKHGGTKPSSWLRTAESMGRATLVLL
ncbi:hypothetical protein M404DRAFT_1003457 [Pisolithus tinctorius Marx 270]|uniref:Uncharacterized protein n=1 Tax=Pisolithus tinctorius Marx 270 TaxID=870435 RepID=A0A0C3P073_PISTI|nr:hypothetical protein M404DRAFT_1003457 [Pisolithus tinctorius Marx 270]